MSKYRVSEGAPGVSLNKRVYLPGEELPETLAEEAAEQLLKSGAIEEVSDKETKASEEQKSESADPKKTGESTTGGGTESTKSTTPQGKPTTSQNKPPATNK